MLDEQIHHSGDVECPSCAEDYPRPCGCGGLVHAVSDAMTTDIEASLTTKCERCGRSEDDLEEVA
jgi:hypothetical protein